MNKNEIKNIILEEIKDALKEMNMSPEMIVADSRPEEDDFAFDKMDGEMYDDGGDPMESVNEDLRGLMAQGEKIAAFADKQSGYEGGVSSPVRGVLAAMTVAGAPDFDGDSEMVSYYTRQLTKAIETQMGRKYMSGLDEMARTSNIFKLKDGAGLKDVMQFMQRVNDVLKTYKSPGQKRPKKRFTPEEMKTLAMAMLKPEGFTSKDVIAATSYTSPAQANKFLAALEQKGLIAITSVLKKTLVPDRDPNAPETRGRKAQSAEFDMSDDPTDMDFGDFDNLDLSDPTALYEETITGEYEGKPVKFKLKDIEGIDDILNRSKGAKDFVNKLAMAVTDETSSLSKEDTKKVILFYNKNKFKPLNQPNNKLKENNNMSDNLTKHIRQQILEAKNPLAAKLKEIEAQGAIAALENKLAAVQEIIEETNERLTRIDEDSEFTEMMDKGAVKGVRKQLKELERAHAKIQKEYDKAVSKSKGGAKKEAVVDEDMGGYEMQGGGTDADGYEEAPVGENATEEDNMRFEGLNGVHDLKPMTTMNESIKRMQKLANLRD